MVSLTSNIKIICQTLCRRKYRRHDFERTFRSNLNTVFHSSHNTRTENSGDTNESNIAANAIILFV